MKPSTKIFLYWGFVTIVLPFGFYLFFVWDALERFMELMSVSFLFFMPFSMGLLAVLLAPEVWTKKLRYTFLVPWIPVFSLCVATLILAIESWGCWVMLMPLFLIFASIGGIFGSYLRSLGNSNNKLNISLAVFLPFLVVPIENMFPAEPAVYTCYTTIDIEAPQDRIWKNVVRVKEISDEEDNGTLANFMGFPRPVKGEFDSAAVGGSRKAFFTYGLVFDEVITEYADQQKMAFSVKVANLPAGMDEHVRIGGKYFNMIDATYEMEPRGNGKYRLHLYSHFEMKTTFNFYAGWWGDWILSDIQNNILQVIRNRCEKP